MKKLFIYLLVILIFSFISCKNIGEEKALTTKMPYPAYQNAEMVYKAIVEKNIEFLDYIVKSASFYYYVIQPINQMGNAYVDPWFLFYVWENSELYSDGNKEYKVAADSFEKFLFDNHFGSYDYSINILKESPLVKYENDTDTFVFSGIDYPVYEISYIVKKADMEKQDLICLSVDLDIKIGNDEYFEDSLMIYLQCNGSFWNFTDVEIHA